FPDRARVVPAAGQVVREGQGLARSGHRAMATRALGEARLSVAAPPSHSRSRKWWRRAGDQHINATEKERAMRTPIGTIPLDAGQAWEVWDCRAVDPFDCD